MAKGYEEIKVVVPIFARFNGEEYEVGSIEVPVEIKTEADDGA